VAHALYCTVTYLPHARKVEPQNQPFLSNTRTNNVTAGLRDPFLVYGSVNTLSRRRMTSHSNKLARSHVICPRRDIPGPTIEPSFLCVVCAKSI
jgi:hypothetical protein